MKNWEKAFPKEYSDAKTELRNLVNGGKHIGCILPAYVPRPDGDCLIPPARYEKTLRKALVTVKAAIIFQNLSGKNMNQDSYYADIREIRVIRAYPGGPTSPSRNKTNAALVRETLKRRGV